MTDKPSGVSAQPPAGPPAEFSRPFRLDLLAAGPAERSLEAGSDERSALARRFSLLAIHALEADLTINRPRHDGPLALRGHLRAVIEQRCVVTLRPVVETIDDTFEVFFSNEPQPSDFDTDSLDLCAGDVEPMPAGPLDLGEVVAQQLSITVNPWPRLYPLAPDATSDVALEGAEDGAEDTTTRRPMAAPLADLKAALSRRSGQPHASEGEGGDGSDGESASEGGEANF